jgi:DNA-binding NarL/FixJ family response regulator
MERSEIRILVVEDFEPFLTLVKSLLNGKPDFELIGTASDGPEAISKAQKLKPDVILLDIGLPTLNGIAAARQIHKLVPRAKIVFLTQETSVEVIREVLNSGAWGYVIKAMAARDLLAALFAVRRGRRFVSSKLTGGDLASTEGSIRQS